MDPLYPTHPPPPSRCQIPTAALPVFLLTQSRILVQTVLANAVSARTPPPPPPPPSLLRPVQILPLRHGRPVPGRPRQFLLSSPRQKNCKNHRRGSSVLPGHHHRPRPEHDPHLLLFLHPRLGAAPVATRRPGSRSGLCHHHPGAAAATATTTAAAAATGGGGVFIPAANPSLQPHGATAAGIPIRRRALRGFRAVSAAVATGGERYAAVFIFFFHFLSVSRL